VTIESQPEESWACFEDWIPVQGDASRAKEGLWDRFHIPNQDGYEKNNRTLRVSVFPFHFGAVSKNGILSKIQAAGALNPRE
jgi:hypothetical protein